MNFHIFSESKTYVATLQLMVASITRTTFLQIVEPARRRLKMAEFWPKNCILGQNFNAFGLFSPFLALAVLCGWALSTRLTKS